MKAQIMQAADSYAAAVRDQAFGGADAAPARAALELLVDTAFGALAPMTPAIAPLPAETAPLTAEEIQLKQAAVQEAAQ